MLSLPEDDVYKLYGGVKKDDINQSATKHTFEVDFKGKDSSSEGEDDDEKSVETYKQSTLKSDKEKSLENSLISSERAAPRFLIEFEFVDSKNKAPEAKQKEQQLVSKEGTNTMFRSYLLAQVAKNID